MQISQDSSSRSSSNTVLKQTARWQPPLPPPNDHQNVSAIIAYPIPTSSIHPWRENASHDQSYKYQPNSYHM